MERRIDDSGHLRRTLFAVALFAFALVLALPLYADDPFGSTDPYSVGSTLDNYKPAYVDGQIIVKLANLEEGAIDEINALYGTETSQFLQRLGVHLIEVPMPTTVRSIVAGPTETNVLSLVDAIAGSDGVLYAHPNYTLLPLQAVQGSFVFPDQNVAAEQYGEQPAVETLDLNEAHLNATGVGVKVAIIDGGVDFDHPALDGRVVGGYDYIDQDNYADDESGGDNSGHGTFVAGIVHLIAPGATIVPYRVTDLTGNSNGYLVAEAILQAVEDDCHVINLSLVSTAKHGAIADAIAWAKHCNVTVIAASGNRPEVTTAVLQDMIPYPASDPNVIAVTAVDELGFVVPYANTGAYVDVCAPGQSLISAFSDGDFAEWGGTSFAAAFVSGQAALVSEGQLPHVASKTVSDVILSTATPMEPQNREYDGELGKGLISPCAALADEPPERLLVLCPPDYPVDSGRTEPVNTGMYVWTPTEQPFSVDYYGTPSFLELPEPGPGPYMTRSFFEFVLNPAGLEPGIYEDTLVVEAFNAINSPVYGIVRLWVLHQDEAIDSNKVITTSDIPETDTWSCEGDDRQPFEAGFFVRLGVLNHDYYSMTYTVSPYEGDELDFVRLIVDTGTVDTSFMVNRFEFEIDPTGLTPGVYYDYLALEVDGPAKTLNPYFAIQYTVYAEDECPVMLDTIRVGPGFVTTYYYEDEIISDVDSIFISSTIGPTAYRIEPADPSVDDYDAVQFTKTDGFTDEWIGVSIDTSNFNYIYHRSWKFDVIGEGSVNGSCRLEVQWRYFQYGASPEEPAPEPELSNYPNPFNPQTTIAFSLGTTSEYSLTIYNILGRQVDRFEGDASAGETVEIEWDGSRYSSGMYFYRLEAGDYQQTKRMVLLK